MLVDKENLLMNEKMLTLEIRILQKTALRYYFIPIKLLIPIRQKFRSLAGGKRIFYILLGEGKLV